MKHVFVETNWVVDWASPAHHQVPAAAELLEKAKRGEIQLHLPAVCLHEARGPIRKNCQPRNEAEAIRKFLLWAVEEKRVSRKDSDIVRTVLAQFQNILKGQIDGLLDTLDSLRNLRGVEVFALDDEIFERTAELSNLDLELQPFDQSILAAVLVRAERLLTQGERDIAFCELDHHLQPWDKNGDPKKLLSKLYDERRIWVYGDFSLIRPAPYEGWPDGVDEWRPGRRSDRDRER